MEQKTPKFRLRLNLFDGIVLVAALAAAAVIGWMALRTTSTPEQIIPGTSQTVRYTLRLQNWAAGTSALVQVGDQLADNGKNLAIGQVVAVEAVPARVRSIDREARRSVWAELEGYEDVLVTVEAPCVITDESITVSGSYELRVGVMAFVKGAGYLGSGPIVSIEQEVQG